MKKQNLDDGLVIKDAQENWAAYISETGCIKKISIGTGSYHEIAFRDDEHRGPRWYEHWWHVNPELIRMKLVDKRTYRFEGFGYDQNICYSLQYVVLNNRLAVKCGIRNDQHTAFSPVKAGIRLGLDCYMDQYPDWNRKYFPSLLRCEKTHFWGYAMSPSGHVLGIGSPDPVASWSIEYKQNYHRVYTFNIDFLNQGPLPSRHPDLATVGPMQARYWTVVLADLGSIEDVQSTMADICQAPMIKADRYTLAKGEACKISVWSMHGVTATMTAPGKVHIPVELTPAGAGGYTAIYKPDEYGLHTLVISDKATGTAAEAYIYVRQPWSWYLKNARNAALGAPQKASVCAESYWGLFSIYLARQYWPDSAVDVPGDECFSRIFALLYNKELHPLIIPHRIQNISTMCSILVARYKCTHASDDLERAAKLADYIIDNHQREDGGYYNVNNHRKEDGSYKQGVLYTSVAYIAKSIMEIMAQEKLLGQSNSAWAVRYARHYQSVKMAMDNLFRRNGNLETEGEMTFEDGMISCSAAQLAMFALIAEPADRCADYVSEAENLLRAHACVTQLNIPDCRMNGATLRHWEAQYDVLMRPNMMNSPHGWSAWRIYGTWYLYLLTGKTEWLRQTMNALGACVQLMDGESGRLRWAFVPDPYIVADVFHQDAAGSAKPVISKKIIGECYVDMISDWWRAPDNMVVGGYSGQGGCCDNDVHEIFKCLEEVALTSAYIVETNPGQFESWNCQVNHGDAMLEVILMEPVIRHVHVNIKSEITIKMNLDGTTRTWPRQTGLRWLY